ncbi:hypothetical protein Sm713_63320 [Streptomyces sp. TS71-3]|nr:hypothetical protein Sm713_63320 [Streptomyces sp. TS71-3]
MVCVAVLLAAAVFGVLHRRADGRLRPRGGAGGPRLGAAQLGQDLGERATLVQFSSAYCQPCRATRRTLTEIADTLPGVGRVELDAAERLDLARELRVFRTPTVLVLDRSGRIVSRASGAPRKADVLAALADAGAA